MAKVAHLINHDFFMLTYGDGLGDVDVSRQLQALSETDLTGSVTGVHPTSRYGELLVEGDRVTSFAEKPPSEGWVSGGFFAFRRENSSITCPRMSPATSSNKLRSRPSAAKESLAFIPHTGFWMGMDTFREYTALNELWATDEAPWKIW